MSFSITTLLIRDGIDRVAGATRRDVQKRPEGL